MGPSDPKNKPEDSASYERLSFADLVAEESSSSYERLSLLEIDPDEGSWSPPPLPKTQPQPAAKPPAAQPPAAPPPAAQPPAAPRPPARGPSLSPPRPPPPSLTPQPPAARPAPPAAAPIAAPAATPAAPIAVPAATPAAPATAPTQARPGAGAQLKTLPINTPALQPAGPAPTPVQPAVAPAPSPPAPPAQSARSSQPSYSAITQVTQVTQVTAAAAAAAVPASTDLATQARIELKRRAERLQGADALGSARAWVELGLLEERLSMDAPAALRCYEQARTLVPGLPAALLRRRRLFEGRVEQVLAAIDDELRAASTDERRADLQAERARACHGAGKLAEARAAYQEALKLAPSHAAALRGLMAVYEDEVAQPGAKAAPADLEAHLARKAAILQGETQSDARLVAWLHVERAQLLDSKLGQADPAQQALRKAVSLQPTPGPVRDAYTRFLVSHHRESELCDALAEEADFEADNERSTRLLYTAARVRAERLKQPAEAIPLLLTALARSTPGSAARRRVLVELSRLHEEAGRLDDAAVTRSQLLPFASDAAARAHEHLRLYELLSALGRTDAAARQARSALDLDPGELPARERLDRTLSLLDRHEDRVALWLEDSRGELPADDRVNALIKAAEIEEVTLRRPREAVALLRSAWAISPGHPRVFDGLSALLAPPKREADEARGVSERLELYSEAQRVAVDPQRKIALLEKVAAIWEDELAQPVRAAEALERVLAIDPHRRTAILALQRTATRARSPQLLVKGLCLEADTSTDPALKRRLLLRAAEVARDQQNDRAAGFQLLEKAEAIDPSHPEALRARATHARLAGRHDEARKTLLALLARSPKNEVFALWIDVALLDEHQRKNLRDAVGSYRQAARLKPGHPLPLREVARLLRQLNDHRALVEALVEVAGAVATPDEQARLLFEAAELQELALGDDEGALRTLHKAQALHPDEAATEAIERILQRKTTPAELAVFYRKWLAEGPQPATRQRVRVALATLMIEGSRTEAIDLLQQTLADAPDLLPARRMLRALLRRTRALGPLVALLQGEIESLRSDLARRGVLWELASLEEQAGEAATLAALERIAAENPRDSAALDGVIRIAGRMAARGEPAIHRARAAIQARRELADGDVERSFFFLEEALLREREFDEQQSSLALPRYRSALAGNPTSLLAARCLARIAAQENAREPLVAAETALGALVEAPAEQAIHLVRAADLLRASPDLQRSSPDLRSPVDLYEQALARDPDCASAATSLALLLSHDPSRLVERFNEALDRAQTPAQLLLLGTEIGRTVLNLHTQGTPGPDPSVGIAAVQRALPHAKDLPALLMLRARLEKAARLWTEARSTLLRLLAVAPGDEALCAAHFALFDLYNGPLLDLDKAQAALEAILVLDEASIEALEHLRALGQSRGNSALLIDALSRLVEHARDHASRVKYSLALSEAHHAAGDHHRRVGSLCVAILFAGPDQRPWNMLAQLFRTSTREGAAAYVDALSLLLRQASELDIPAPPRWLTTIGQLESSLFRHQEALAHLRQAVALPSATIDDRAALGLGLEAASRNDEAIHLLRDLLTESDGLRALTSPVAALSALESAIAKEGRTEEQIPVQELRGILGAMPEDWLAAMRARRLPPGSLNPSSLAGAEQQRLLPSAARGPLTAVAAAIAPIAARVLNFNSASLNLSSRERISARDGHPTRSLAERVARQLGVEAFDFYLSASYAGPLRAYPGDPPFIVAPTSFADLPEIEQAAALTRHLLRIALGVPFLEDLPLDQLEGLLFSAVCATEPTFASSLPAARERATQGFLPQMQRAIGRRQRKTIEETIHALRPDVDLQGFPSAIRVAEHRFGYLATGALLSTYDALRHAYPVGDAPLQHPLTFDLMRFALSEVAYVERLRIGSCWTDRRPAS